MRGFELDLRDEPGMADDPRPRFGHLLTGARWLVLVWAAYLLPSPRGAPGDWHFFVQGSRLLFVGGPSGGLHTFAAHPFLQVGPLSLVAAYMSRLGSGGSGYHTAAIEIMALGLLAVFFLERACGRLTSHGSNAPGLLAATAGGVMLLRQWSEIAAFGHLDDALALVSGSAAVYSVASRRPLLAGIAVGIGIASKPWAIFFIPLLFVFRDRKAALACGAAAAVAIAAWLPFVVADPATLAAGKFTIFNWPDSTLRLLGVQSTSTPEWIRPAQLIACLVAGSLMVWRGRWPVLPLVVVATRLLLDGGTYPYYETGLILGAVLIDAVVLPFALPVLTLLLFGAFQLLPYVPNPAERGLVRSVILAACLLVPLGLYSCNPFLTSLRSTLFRATRASATMRVASRGSGALSKRVVRIAVGRAWARSGTPKRLR